MSRKRKQMETFPTLLLAVLLSVCLHSPAHATVEITSDTDTSWRFPVAAETYNFADGLNYEFSSPPSQGAIINTPGVTYNSMGSLSIGIKNIVNPTGVLVQTPSLATSQAKLTVTGSDVHFSTLCDINPALWDGQFIRDLSGLIVMGNEAGLGAQVQFDNKNTYISAGFTPPTNILSAGSNTTALAAGSGSTVVFNGNAFLEATGGNENSLTNIAVVSSTSSDVEFNGAQTQIKGITYHPLEAFTFTGIAASGPDTKVVLNSPDTSIDLTSFGKNTTSGISLYGGSVSVTDKVKNFTLSATTTGNIVTGINTNTSATTDIKAENTTITTHSDNPTIGEGPGYSTNAAVLVWGKGRVNIGGKNVKISTSGVGDGGIALFANGGGAYSNQGLGGDIIVNADNITITSSTTGTGNKVAAFAQVQGTININSDETTGADLGKTVNITGDVYAIYSGKTTLNLGNADSLFTGLSDYTPKTGTDAGILNIGLTNNARWNVTGNSSVTNFTAGGGHAYVGSDAAHFATMTRDPSDFTPVSLYMENLKGTNGNFYLRADIDGEKADTLYIVNGEGNHNLFVRSQGVEPSSEAMNQYLAHQERGSAQFSLGNSGGLVDAGLYVYELAQRTVLPGTQVTRAAVAEPATEWYLKRATRPVPPTPEPTPIAPVAPEANPIPSPTGEAEMALSGLAGHYAMWYGEQTDLRKRLGEIRYGTQTGLWVRGFADKSRLDGFNGGRFTQETYGGSIGYDKIVAEDETWMWFLGMQLRGARANQKVKGYWGGTGDLDSLGAGLYSTWAHADGWYVDAVATYDHYNHKIRTTMLDGIPVSDDRSAYGLGASLEAGRKILFGFSEDQRDYWFVEPQLQLSYFWVKGGDFTASNGMTIDQRNMDSLNGRAGFVLGKKFELGEKKERGTQPYVQPYVKAGVNHEFLGDQVVRINDTRMESDLDGTRVYYGAGVDWQVNDNLRLYTQAEREHGSHFTREFNVSAGFKWEF